MLKLQSPNILFDKRKILSKGHHSVYERDGKRVVILYESAQTELPDTERGMLDKMMQACKCKQEEVLYINLNGKNTSLGDLINQYSPELVLVFGKVSVSRNMQEMKKNIPHVISNVKVVPAESLDKLVASTDEKQRLWAILQKVLNLN